MVLERMEREIRAPKDGERGGSLSVSGPDSKHFYFTVALNLQGVTFLFLKWKSWLSLVTQLAKGHAASQQDGSCFRCVSEAKAPPMPTAIHCLHLRLPGGLREGHCHLSSSV